MSKDFELELLPSPITIYDSAVTKKHRTHTEDRNEPLVDEDSGQVRLDISDFLKTIKSENDDTLTPICRDPRAPDVFFIPEDILFDPSKTAEPTASRTRREGIAKEICNICKIQTQCLDIVYSLDSEIYDISGIWGGLTEQERKSRMRHQVTKSA